MSNLREQFLQESKFKFTGTQLLFETKNSEYIKWLENKLNICYEKDIISDGSTD